MKKILLMLFVTFVTAGSFAQVKVKDSLAAAELKPQEVTGGEKEKIVEGILRDKDFLKACEIIGHDNEQIDPKRPSVFRVGKRLQIKWKITSAARTNDVSFGILVADLEGNRPFVYFDEKNEKYMAPPKSSTTTAKLKWPPSWWPGGGGGGGTGGGGGGGTGLCWFNWSPWTTVSTKCDYAYACVFKNQQATFVLQTRYCFGNLGNVQTRWTKLRCGC